MYNNYITQYRKCVRRNKNLIFDSDLIFNLIPEPAFTVLKKYQLIPIFTNI